MKYQTEAEHAGIVEQSEVVAYYTAAPRQRPYPLAQGLFDDRAGERRLTGAIAAISTGVNGPVYA